MKNSLRSSRGAAVIACALALVALAVTSAGAAPKAAFAPKTGSYTGTVSTEGHNVRGSARVAKKGNSYSVVQSIPFGGNCETKYGPVFTPLQTHPLTMAVKGKAFSFVGKAPSAGSGLGEMNVTIKGHFTSASAYTATATAEVPSEAGNPEAPKCTVAPVTLKMKVG